MGEEKREEYNMTRDEFISGSMKLIQKLQDSIFSNDKQTMVETADLLNTFIQCHKNI